MSTNSIIAFVYCGVASVSAFILIYNALTVKDITPKYSFIRYAYLAILFSGIAAIFDCAYTLRELEVVKFNEFLSYVFTLIYAICLTLVGLFWVEYSERKQKSLFVKTKIRFILYSLPLYIILAIIISTPLSHLYFYFDGIHYERGPLFILLSSILFLYVLQTGITAFIRSFKKENYLDRNDLRRLFYFALVYIIIQIVQFTLPSVFPYRSVLSMLFFEIFLVENMKELIGRDPLTHINNRFATEHQLGTMFKSKDDFELVIIDVDKFKSINDKFGHQEGDKALQYVTTSLKDSVTGSSFIGRMGGDEFVIINSDLNTSIENIEEKINDHLKKVLEKHNCKYNFTVSAGYALKTEKIMNIPDLIKLADSNLYYRKNTK